MEALVHSGVPPEKLGLCLVGRNFLCCRPGPLLPPEAFLLCFILPLLAVEMRGMMLGFAVQSVLSASVTSLSRVVSA